MEVHKKPIFKISEIPAAINGVTLSKQDINNIMYGEPSGMLRNMIFDEVRLDGKVWLSRDQAGYFEINYLFSRQTTPIEYQLEDFMIPKEEAMRLMNDQTVGPFRFSGQHVFLQVDQDLNRIVVKSGHEINVPKKIAGYSLTAEDMNTLANGGKMKSRLFSVEGKYFTAEIGMNADRRCLIFDNYNEQSHLSKEQLKNLESSLNPSLTPLPYLEITQLQEKKRASRTKKFAKYTLNPADEKDPVHSGISGQQELFRDAVDHYDMNTLVHLKKTGFLPEASDIDYIKNNINLDREEKISLAMVLEINQMEVLYDENYLPIHVSHIQSLEILDRETDTALILQPSQTKNTESDLVQNEESEQKNRDPRKPIDSYTIQKVGNMITESFNNM